MLVVRSLLQKPSDTVDTEWRESCVVALMRVSIVEYLVCECELILTGHCVLACEALFRVERRLGY